MSSEFRVTEFIDYHSEVRAEKVSGQWQARLHTSYQHRQAGSFELFLILSPPGVLFVTPVYDILRLKIDMNYILLFFAAALFFLNGLPPAPGPYPGKSVSGRADTLKYPPCNTEKIPHYTAYKVTTAPCIDGRLDEKIWQDAPHSPAFRDLVSGEKTIHDTKAAVLWDDEYLYVGYWIEEPDVQATLTKRDSPIYENNDVELFIAGRDTYYEFEINALGTIYEVFFIWEEAYQRGRYDTLREFSMDQPGRKPFQGVAYKPHPRGLRFGFWNWDLKGLKSAVFIDGTINNSRDRDRGWTVELALPWSGLSDLARGGDMNLPPKDQDIWRMDFSRFNQYKEAPPAHDSGGWAWSPHYVWDSHVPECFTFIRFSTENVIER